MPELAEVEYYRKQWIPALGDQVREVHIHGEKRIFRGTDPAALANGLKSRPFSSARRHGKQLCFVFGSDSWLGIHLGMTGKIQIRASGPPPGKHDHLVLSMGSGRDLVFTDPRLFGRVRFAVGPIAPAWWQELPPEVLQPGFTHERLNVCLKRRSKAPIKAVLLMQDYFPGVGNWMADEILWRARIRPATPAGSLGPRKRKELYTKLIEVCEDALRVIGTNWSRPPETWLFNHRWRDGGSCPQTGKPLRRETVGGRTTCWSPAWQTYHGKT